VNKMRKFAIGLAAAALATGVPLSANAFHAATGNEPTIQRGVDAYADLAQYYGYAPDYYGGGFYGRRFYHRPFGFYGRRFYGHRFYGRPYGRDYYWRGYGPW
jgi:hypothetical protein